MCHLFPTGGGDFTGYGVKLQKSPHSDGQSTGGQLLNCLVDVSYTVTVSKMHVYGQPIISACISVTLLFAVWSNLFRASNEIYFQIIIVCT